MWNCGIKNDAKKQKNKQKKQIGRFSSQSFRAHFAWNYTDTKIKTVQPNSIQKAADLWADCTFS